MILYALAASGLVALAIVLFVVLTGGGGGGGADAAGAKAAVERAGGTFQTVKALGAGNHLTSLTQKVNPAYNTSPPTSGPHMPTPAPWGIYEDPINQKILVHNLEHGGIVVQYGPRTPPTTKDDLSGFFQDSPNGIVIVPNPTLGNRIVLEAWTAEDLAQGDDPRPGTSYLARLPRYDEEAFKEFRDAFRYQGPERIPPDLMQPGQ
jgi:hypothetical protein